MHRPRLTFGIGVACLGLLAVSTFADTYPYPPNSGETRPPATTDNIASQLQDRALPELINNLTERKSSKRLRLIRVTGDIHDYRASPYLVQAYEESTSEGIRCKLLESLGKLQDPSLLDWYVKRLAEPSVGIQCFAIWALGELRLPQAAEPLRRKIWSPNRYVQMSAIDALGKTGRNPDITAQLIIFLGDGDVQLRFLAAKALSGTAGIDAVPELLRRLLQEPSLDVQETLARTTSQVGGMVAVGYFIELLKNPQSQSTDHWAEVGLKSADPSLVIPAITPFLNGDDFRLKVSASNILGDLELIPQRDLTADWILTVREWAQKPAPFTREAATRLLDRVDVMKRQFEEGAIK